MRVLALTKRQYTDKDLLDDRFGRIRELLLGLARRGHEVTGACLSYAPRAEEIVVDHCDQTHAGVTWHSLNAGRFKGLGLMRFLRFSHRLAKTVQPDVVIAFSDTLYGIVGARIAKACGAAFVFDLYDHFESFGSASIPGVRRLYRRAIEKADGVTCVSDMLHELIRDQHRPVGPILTVVNAVRKDLFFPRDRRLCRQSLSLPEDAQIIGTAGALYADRGTTVLFSAFEQLNVQGHNVHLAVAGPREAARVFPKHPNIHDFGMLPHDVVPTLLNSLDVAVVCLSQQLQWQYAFPNKAYEILACGLPVVAANVGPMRHVLANHPECLYQHDSPDELARAIAGQLKSPSRINLPSPGWDNLAGDLEHFLQEVTAKKRPCEQTTPC